MAKFTKEAVDYSKGMASKHCGICEHYTSGRCELVAGSIRPDMWCIKFKKESNGGR